MDCNACNNVSRLNDEHRAELFKIGISYLDEKDRLKTTILNGMPKTHVRAILRLFENYFHETLKKNLVVDSKLVKEAGNIRGIWSRLTEFMEDEKTVIIVGLAEYHDHWTCIVGIDDKRIRVCDSDGLKWIRKEHCTFGEPVGDRKHRIFTGDVFGITLE